MLARLAGLKTASTVVIIAANTAVTVRSSNNGVNFFYDADIVIPDSLALPTPPSGQTPGLSTDEALARCGRL